MQSFSNLLAFLLCLQTAQAQWQIKDWPSANDYPTQFISAGSSNSAWVALGEENAQNGEGIGFARTTNGGGTWSFGDALQQPYWGVTSIFAFDAAKCYITAYADAGSGRVLRTTDGGNTWQNGGNANMFLSPEGFPNGIHFFNANEGVVFGDPNGGYYEIWRTTNGGSTWTRVPSASIPLPPSGGTPEYGIANNLATFGNSIWFGTNYGRIFRSSDKGATWKVSDTPLPPLRYIGGIAFKDAMNGLAVAGASLGGPTAQEVMQTTDGGATWTFIAGSSTGAIKQATDLAWVPGAQVYVISSDVSGTTGSMYSSDNGKTWTTIASIFALSDMDFEGNVGWGVPESYSTYYKWTGIVPADEVGEGKTLFALAPNPCKDFFQVQLPENISGEESVRISINNALGKTLQSREFPAREIMFAGRFDVSALPTGSYFVSCRAGNSVSSKILLKQ